MANLKELRWTVSLMLSSDWKMRMVGEYRQLDIRIKSLEKTLENRENGHLEYTPLIPKDLLEDQLKVMKEYRNILRIRAEIEDIDFEYI